MHFKNVIVVVFIIMLPALTLGQGKFTDPKKGGLLLGYTHTDLDNDYSGRSFSLGIISKSNYEFGFEIGKYSHDKSISDNYFLKNLTIHFKYYLGQEKFSLPFSVALRSAFDLENLGNDVTIGGKTSDDFKTYLLGISIYKNLPLTKKSKLQPYAGLNYINILEVDETKQMFYNLGLSYIIGVGKIKLYATTEYIINSDLNLFRAGTGIIFSGLTNKIHKDKKKKRRKKTTL
ncbi:MAG: hypothetical protein U9N54_01920 [candidate division Zixibacteria bacterium]|nr:hypothetical protein [candidate division Zixibacteria bacterium]